MRTKEFWFWLIPGRDGKLRKSGWRMTAEDAAGYPGAVRVEGSCEVRNCPETGVEMARHAASAPWPSFRLLVCGGRDYVDRERMFAALDAADRKRHITTIIHGAAPGADSLAGEWAKERGREALAFPAKWADGPKAGPTRNQQMIDYGKPDAVLAAPGNKGTADMCRRADAAGLPIWRPYG